MSGIWTSLKRLVGVSPGASRSEHSPEGSTVLGVKVIHSQAELAREIRTLTTDGREPSEQELFALQDRFSRNLACELPHFIGHWFADADIRRRDAEYSKAQGSELEEALRQMEGTHAT
jgi:hypothetical protein